MPKRPSSDDTEGNASQKMRRAKEPTKNDGSHNNSQQQTTSANLELIPNTNRATAGDSSSVVNPGHEPTTVPTLH